MATTKGLIDKFIELERSYNLRQEQLPPNFLMLNELAKEKEMEKYLEAGVEIFKPKFQDLLYDTQALTKQKIQEKNKKKFPLRFSENLVERQLGEQKLAYSLLFFNIFKESPDLILIELKKLFEQGDIDSLNVLIDLVLLNGNSEDSTFEKLLVFKKEVDENLKISEVEDELKFLESLESDLRKVLLALQNNIPYLLLPSQFSSITDSEFFELRDQLTNRFGEQEAERIFSLQ